MRVLYVTSFNSELYQATGHRLVESFLRCSGATLLACHEDHAGSELPDDPRIRQYDLDTSKMLHGWLTENTAIIPANLGGTAGPCDCDARDEPFGPHRTGCHWFWFNRNASRWFRKLVALDHAQSLA